MGMKEELMSAFENKDEYTKKIVEKVIDEAVFLANIIVFLKKLPFIVVKKGNPNMQRRTEAAKQYKELLPQYVALMKTLLSISGKAVEDKDDPVKKWMEKYEDSA